MIEKEFNNQSRWYVVCKSWGWNAVHVDGPQTRPTGVNFDKYRDAAVYAEAGSKGETITMKTGETWMEIYGS